MQHQVLPLKACTLITLFDGCTIRLLMHDVARVAYDVAHVPYDMYPMMLRMFLMTWLV